MAAQKKIKVTQPPKEDIKPLNFEQEQILEWLKKVRFKKNFLGGVDEADVWKKIGELNNLYNAALNAERVRYDTLLEQAKSSKNTNSQNGGEA